MNAQSDNWHKSQRVHRGARSLQQVNLILSPIGKTILAVVAFHWATPPKPETCPGSFPVRPGLFIRRPLSPMAKLPPAARYTLDALLIVVPLIVMTYFLFDPAAFNAFTAWLARVL
jgi:hypothetical protein